MNDRRAFAAGMTALATMHQREVSKETMREYWGLLEQEITDQQFARAVEVLKASERFPSPALLLRTARLEGESSVRAGAVTLFEQVVRASGHNPYTGTTYRLQKVVAQCGELAGVLFQAAGGGDAFEGAARDPEQMVWIRKAFVEAALDRARMEPEARRVLASGDLSQMRALPAANESFPDVRAIAPSVRELAKQIGSGASPAVEVGTHAN